jgi:hypothetical protein
MKKDITESLRNAFLDKDVNQLNKLGDFVAKSLQEDIEKFSLRQLFFIKKAAPTEKHINVEVDKDKVNVIFSITKDVSIKQERIRNNFFYPDDYTTCLNYIIEEEQINQLSFSFQKSYEQMLNAFLYRENKIICKILKINGFSEKINKDPFSLPLVCKLLTNFHEWDLTPVNLVMSNNSWKDFCADPSCIALYTKLDDVITINKDMENKGDFLYNIGSFMGINLIVEKENKNHKQENILQNGEFFLTACPTYLGRYLQKTPISFKKVDKENLQSLEFKNTQSLVNFSNTISYQRSSL